MYYNIIIVVYTWTAVISNIIVKNNVVIYLWSINNYFLLFYNINYTYTSINKLLYASSKNKIFNILQEIVCSLMSQCKLTIKENNKCERNKVVNSCVNICKKDVENDCGMAYTFKYIYDTNKY